MNVYLVERTDNCGYVEDYAMVIVAKDELHAERLARQSSGDFKKNQHLKLTPISLEEESCVLKANTGA